MANMFDYLTWRGDLTLSQSPFQDVDSLILSTLAYVFFDGILSESMEETVTIAQAAELYFARPQEVWKSRVEEDWELLKHLAESERFSKMELCGYVNKLDFAAEKQFSALTILIGDGMAFVAYRGTDSSSVGWKEDFNMSFMDTVPSQQEAGIYLCRAAEYFKGKLRVGGHSKGGNLAVWAGVFCPTAVQRRIAAVWSNDGPGFHDDILSLPRHIRLAERIHTIVPKSSVVGMLLEHEEDYTVVDSSQQGLMQHDGFSWAVLGNRFVRLHSVTRQARLTDQELRGWVQGLTVEQREKFVDSAFQVLEASGAQTLTDLKADSFKAVRPMVRALKDLDKETREALLKFMSILFMSNLRMTLEGIQEETEKSLLRNGKKAERSAGKKG